MHQKRHRPERGRDDVDTIPMPSCTQIYNYQENKIRIGEGGQMSLLNSMPACTKQYTIPYGLLVFVVNHWSVSGYPFRRQHQ